jgi:two-component system, sensor histidine kinase
MAALVVLIEDDPLVRLGQSMLLKDWGYEVVADASLSAVKAALKGATAEIAAIITDYHLGDSGTGPDAALALAKDVGTSIPTLVLSASLGRSSGQAAALHGFDMLEKPVDPERLRGWLAAAIRCAA